MFRKKKNEQGGQQEETPPPAHEKYDLVTSILSDVGCVRELNEDSGDCVCPGDAALRASKGVLAIVADGMGGHSAGEVASGLAVETVRRAYYEAAGEPQAALKNAFHEANREIYKAAERDESKKGMGTTCTALVLQNGTAISAHVGDSRLYLVRDGQIYLMTEDHSAVMELVKAGAITLEQARHHPDKNVILRAMGSHPEVEVATWKEPFPVKAGDSFLVCSDGLYDLVEDEEIKQIIMINNPRAACQNLVELAKERGGHDNITVVITSLKPEGYNSKPVPETREVEVMQ
jgi:serine/threonine protein phosphatase PrpC